jgi:hypothetical protein
MRKRTKYQQKGIIYVLQAASIVAEVMTQPSQRQAIQFIDFPCLQDRMRNPPATI